MNYFKTHKLSLFLFLGGCIIAGSIQASTQTISNQNRSTIASTEIRNSNKLNNNPPKSKTNKKKLETIDRLKKDISYLASDELQGRQTGSPGELASAKHIAAEFEKSGLKLLGNNGFQEFTMTQFRMAAEECKFFLISPDGAAPPREFKLFEEFYPLSQTCNYDSVSAATIDVGYGIVAERLNKNDYQDLDVKGKIVVMRLGYFGQEENPHSEISEFSDINTKVKEAISRGAVGVIFIRTKKTDDDPSGKLNRTTTPTNIPVFYFKANTIIPQGLHVKMVSKVISPLAIGHNVVAYKNNFKKKTIVICAHHDHIGFNEYENSRYTGKLAIHNGADDNASGVAAMLELSRKLKGWKYRKNNYLFIAFSGEELGLLGSKYFTQNPLIPMKKINYVINIDMLGRIDSTKKTLTINGVGTSPVWKEVLTQIKTDTAQLFFNSTESGMGPSDHASFYLENIPVLHFFSGQHRDYHTPDDDENRINYDGMYYSLDIIQQIIKGTKRKKLPFTKTKDPSPGKTRFKVTLGVMPDYSFSGKGLRVDGVTADKPAAKAGLQRNDIVTKLGDWEINDINDYMSALGKFNKGDKTTISFTRGTEVMSSTIEF
jgi:hypothetical protein